MSVNPLGSLANFNLGKFVSDKPPFLDIFTKSNEILSPTGLLQRVVGKALGGTKNAARVTDFLTQSGLSLPALPQPLQNKNGENIFRFPTGEKFWHSIGTFQQTGNALPLMRSLNENEATRTPNFTATNLNNSFASKQGVSNTIERARLTPQTQTKQNKPELSFDKLTDAKGTTYSGKADDLKGDEVFGIKVKVEKDDTSESLLTKGNEAAARAAGYDPVTAARIAEAYVAKLKEAGVTGVADVNPQTAEVIKDTDTTKLKDLRAKGEMSFYVTGATIKEFDRINYQGQLQDAIAQGKPLTQEMIERSGVDREKLNSLLKEMNWQPIPTFDEAIDKLAAQKKADVLTWRGKAMSSAAVDVNFANSKWYGMTDEQITAETKREATADIRRQIGKGELTVRRDDRPDSISPGNTPKWQTDAKLMIEKYLPGLADLNSPEGIKTTAVEAFTASFVNARLFGATDFYVDQSRFHNERERDNAQIMSTAGSLIGELQNLSLAGKTVEAAMATGKVAQGLKILNESGRAGKLIAQALPSAVTFGGLETTKETVKNATGNGEGLFPAVTNVAKATTTGAVFGVLQPLAVGVRVPAVVAASYGVEKVFGATDKEAAMNALTNGLFAAAGGRANAEQLNGKVLRVTGENGTATNVKVTVDVGKRIVLTEVAQNAKADLMVGLPRLREAARVNILNESVPLSKENGGAIFRTTGERAGELKYLQTMQTRNGVVLKELTAEQYLKAKGTVPEVEISNRQFNAANGVRLTADSKIITTEEWRLAKNLDSAQGVNLRETRLVTPTNAEFVRKIEVQKGLQRVESLRQEYNLTTRDLKKANVAFSDFEIGGRQWTQTAHSGERSANGTAPVPFKRYYKTGVDNFDRSFDSEVKILEDFTAKYVDQAKEIKGTIYLFTERPPCKICTDVVRQFREKFPNVKIEVADGGYKENARGKKQ